ncbi:MAG: T9SS type A sorting domain-containing protein [Ignavibacteriales bacterium]|nr:T9SS type A sorting domain-containing protein [Ignavibacteriales bacterium]
MKSCLFYIGILILFCEEMKAQYSWETVTLPTGGIVYSILCVDNNSVLCCNNLGVFLSTNQGLDWSGSLTSASIRLRCDTLGNIFAGGGGLKRINAKNVNNSNAWTNISLGQSNGLGFADFLVTPSGNIYVATGSNGIYFSSNNGSSWVRRDTGLSGKNVSQLYRLPNNYLIAATNKGVYLSKDSGNTWLLSGLDTALVNTVAFSKRGNLYAGGSSLADNMYSSYMYKSVDTGKTWNRISGDITTIFSIVVDDSEYIYVGTDIGLFRSIDSGSTWEQNSHGLDQDRILELIFGPGNKMYAGTKNGIFLSPDRGQNWFSINAGLSNVVVYNIVPYKDTTLFAGTSDGVFQSTDRGYHWIKKSNQSTAQIAVGLQGEIYPYNSAFMRQTFDGGFWNYYFNTSIYSAQVRDFDIDTASGKYYATTSNKGIMVSSDFGSTWNSLDQSLDTMRFWLSIFPAKNVIYSASVNWSSNGYFFNGDIYRISFNGLTKIEKIASLGEYINTMISVDDHTFYAACDTGGVYFSQDTGKTWSNLGLGGAYSLYFDGSNIIAGTSRGCYTLPVNGNSLHKQSTSWNLMFSGAVRGIIALKDRSLYAGGTSGRIFKGTLIPTNISSERDLMPQSYSLLQNYPNPFNPSTTISFNLPCKSFVSLKIFDLIGREVATVVSEELSAGRYAKQWIATGMPSGVYFYRLQTGSFTETKKLVLLR